jgi:3-oxoacyl-[acyl-carrier-protein] synthase II
MGNGPRRRVAVTGWSVVSPAGPTVEDFWAALLTGRSLARPIASYDTSGQSIGFACEVPPLSTNLLDVADRRRLARATQFAVVAGHAAVEHAGVADMPPTRAGVACGTGIGGISM